MLKLSFLSSEVGIPPLLLLLLKLYESPNCVKLLKSQEPFSRLRGAQNVKNLDVGMVTAWTVSLGSCFASLHFQLMFAAADILLCVLV
jgi:hypothetical protein